MHRLCWRADENGADGGAAAGSSYGTYMKEEEGRVFEIPWWKKSTFYSCCCTGDCGDHFIRCGSDRILAPILIPLLIAMLIIRLIGGSGSQR